MLFLQRARAGFLEPVSEGIHLPATSALSDLTSSSGFYMHDININNLPPYILETKIKSKNVKEPILD